MMHEILLPLYGVLLILFDARFSCLRIRKANQWTGFYMIGTSS